MKGKISDFLITQKKFFGRNQEFSKFIKITPKKVSLKIVNLIRRRTGFYSIESSFKFGISPKQQRLLIN